MKTFKGNKIPVPFPYKTWEEFDADLAKRLKELAEMEVKK